MVSFIVVFICGTLAQNFAWWFIIPALVHSVFSIMRSKREIFQDDRQESNSGGQRSHF